jgi:hypothetical protein
MYTINDNGNDKEELKVENKEPKNRYLVTEPVVHC